jgi:hypothetical protein
MRVFRQVETAAKQLPWIASEVVAGTLGPPAAEFYRWLQSGSYFPDLLINVVPTHKILYLLVPKAASIRIRLTLASVVNRRMRSLNRGRRCKYRGPYGPRSMTVGSFFRLPTSSETLRFSFVRNPYARAVSCSADKKPLVVGDHFVDFYLAHRRTIDASLAVGPDRTLPFSDFVTFAAAIAKRRGDIHIQTQEDILSMPGINLDFTGKVESFWEDFACVFDHIGANHAVRREAAIHVNESHCDDWPNYYTGDLADLIYRAYECDFDQFGYPRSLAFANVRRRVGHVPCDDTRMKDRPLAFCYSAAGQRA